MYTPLPLSLFNSLNRFQDVDHFCFDQKVRSTQTNVLDMMYGDISYTCVFVLDLFSVLFGGERFRR